MACSVYCTIAEGDAAAVGPRPPPLPRHYETGWISYCTFLTLLFLFFCFPSLSLSLLSAVFLAFRLFAYELTNRMWFVLDDVLCVCVCTHPRVSLWCGCSIAAALSLPPSPSPSLSSFKPVFLPSFPFFFFSFSPPSFLSFFLSFFSTTILLE